MQVLAVDIQWSIVTLTNDFTRRSVQEFEAEADAMTHSTHLLYWLVWRGGSMVSVRDSRSEGREFDPRPRHTA